MTAWGSIQLAVQGMQAGAFDFITKPWNNVALLYQRGTFKLVGKNCISVPYKEIERRPTRDILHVTCLLYTSLILCPEEQKDGLLYCV